MLTRITLTARCSALFLTMAMVSAPRAADITPSTQACNGAELLYEGANGSTYGMGSSARKARDNAIDLAWGEIAASAGVPDCANCPNGLPCPEAYGVWWSPTYGEPYWDPLLKTWRVSVAWENAAYVLRCDPCS